MLNQLDDCSLYDAVDWLYVISTIKKADHADTKMDETEDRVADGGWRWRFRSIQFNQAGFTECSQRLEVGNVRLKS